MEPQLDQWQPSQQQLDDWKGKGYFILRDVVPRDTAIELRGVIKDTILQPEPDAKADADPMDPMGNTPEARAARFRKLSNFCSRSPLIWHNFHANPAMAAVGRYFLGDDFFLKFNSCFLKPARTGSATPWHQDNGLWRDGETEPFNFWMALDPATTENGCLQFIPGSHRGEIWPHVLYPDSIHGELPRARVQELMASHGLEQMELDSGDVVCWHSSVCHYSPPNPSPHGRMAIAGVYSSRRITRQRQFAAPYYWILRQGELVRAFPPEEVEMPQAPAPGPFPQAEETIDAVPANS